MAAREFGLGLRQHKPSRKESCGGCDIAIHFDAAAAIPCDGSD
jgi:hypothetical protein